MIWTQVKEKGDSILYGTGPLIWAMLTFHEIKAYPSSLSFTIQLSIISCCYSLLALTFQVVTRQSAYGKKLSQADAIAAD